MPPGKENRQKKHTNKYCSPHYRVVPSLLRESSYSTLRIGAYEPLKRLFGATDPAHTPLWKKICAGAISGNIYKGCNNSLNFKYYPLKRYQVFNIQ